MQVTISFIYLLLFSNTFFCDNSLKNSQDGDGILTIAETGGIPANGFLEHYGGSCDASGVNVDSSNCVAAIQTHRRLAEIGINIPHFVDLTPFSML